MPVPIHIHSGAFSSMAVMGPGTGYRRTVPSWGSKRLRLWQPPVHIHPPESFPMSLIYWSGRPSAAKEGGKYSTLPVFFSILYRPEAYPPAQMTPGETSQSVRKIWFPPSCIPSDRLRKERHRPTAGCSRLIPLLVANYKSPSLSSMTSCTWSLTSDRLLPGECRNHS